MKLYMMFIVLVLSSLLNYEAQGMRVAKVTLPSRSLQEIIKISSVEGSNQDHELLAKTVEVSSGINRKLMASSAATTNTIAKNHKNDGNKHNPRPQIKSTHGLAGKEENFSFNSSPENAKHGKTEVAAEGYPDVIDIAGMDYTPARKKSPIHN